MIHTETLYRSNQIIFIQLKNMGFLHREKNHCETCHEKFDRRDDLIQHARKVHYQSITKCRNCGMEFLHEEDRLHHVKQEKERKTDVRRHR